MNQVIVDVREDDEFNAEHVENALHVPLGSFSQKAPAILKALGSQDVVIMCLGGKRARLALDQAQAFGLGARGPKITVYEGGIQAWKAKGNPTVCAKGGHFPIMRQVQIVAGSLVLGSVLAVLFVDPRFIYLAGFVGAGLTFAGVSGICMMAELLARLPWNRSCP